ncbi:MAG TPA: hypothetical protein VFG72_07710 [Marmoricola sp.]|nr:hypothetical protein [Marmoricola sp.]
MGLDVRAADHTTIRRLDGLALLWLVLWVVIGGWTGYTIWQFSELGDTVSTSGRAIGSTGDALTSLEGLPVVGDRTAELGAEVVAAGEEIVGRGQEAQSQLRQLSVLLGLAIVVLPAAPVLGMYVPLRAQRRRDVAEVRRMLNSSADAAVTDRYLAERAVHRLPFAVVQAVDADPWRALAEGRTRPLADAELQRIGLPRARG